MSVPVARSQTESQHFLSPKAAQPVGWLCFWHLSFVGHGGSPGPLYSFATATSEVITVSEFITNTLAEYQRESAVKQDEIYKLRIQENRINFLRQFDRPRVREACAEAVRNMPTHWWPRLTLAIVDASHGRYREANKELVDWVESNPSYSRYIYLAYFYQVMEKPDEAAMAMGRAITCPIVDLPDDITNTECRGYSAAIYALRSRKYSTVVKLCDALLPVRDNAEFAKAALKLLKEAALYGQSGEVPDFQPSEEMLLFNPYEEVDLGTLRGL
jgi:hypothetical protein